MIELVTAAQMRAIEQAAIESGVVTGLELMERAGQGVVDAILEWRPELAEGAHSAVVLCGPGNNGGDGFVIARLLHARGWDVEVYLYGCLPDDLSKLPPDAQTNARRWVEACGLVRAVDDWSTSKPGSTADLLLDGLFGTGLTRPVVDDSGWLPRLIGEHVWHIAKHRVAVDIPTGVCADSGRVLCGSDALPLGNAFRADLTVTFHAAKFGHHLGEGPSLCGDLRICDIGLDDTEVSRHRKRGTGPRLRDASLDAHVRALVDKATGLGPHHKYDHGHTLVLTGGVGKGGAARLAARAALRIGSGLVTVGCPPAALIENACRLDAIMLRPMADAEALRETLSDPRLNAVCLGPGLGVGSRTIGLVEAACAPTDARSEEVPRAVVLDADALTSFRETPDALFRLLHPRCVLTPHEGEFGRLFPDIQAKLKAAPTTGPAYSKVDATREAAKRAGCVVLFKGADTVIADPSGRAAINSAHYERAAPWLATAGSGDVLAGMIAGLLARGRPPMGAAETAAWLHVECALAFGPGLIAEDLPEQLPAAFARLGL